MKQIIKWATFWLVCASFANCSNTKYLSEGQNLYIGTQINIQQDSAHTNHHVKELSAALANKTRPKPNFTLLGLRPTLLIYNWIGTSKKNKGLRNWVRKKAGQAPVLLSQLNLSYNKAVLNSYLTSQGYLQAKIKGDTSIHNKRAKAIYTVNPGKRYQLNQIIFPADTDQLTHLIASQKQNSLLKTGNHYNLDVFINERIRIDTYLKENGYFYFNPDYLILQVDSTIGNHKVDVYVNLKKSIPPAATKPYIMRDVKIYPNYNLRDDSTLNSLKPINYNGLKIYDDKKTFKPGIWNRLIFFKPKEIYSRQNHNLSLQRLVSIGAFQNVRGEFLPADSFKNNQLDLGFYLTPYKKNSLSLSVLGTTKSNNFAGSSLQLSQTFHNIFKGAEQLQINAAGGFEWQYGTQLSAINSYNFSLGGKLIYPRYVVPFFNPQSTSLFIPKTIFSLKADFLSRDTIYKLSSFTGEYGFSWKENVYKEHNLNLVSISYVKPIKGNINAYNTFVNNNPALRNILKRELIIGANYNFSYNDQIEENKKNNIFFYGGIDIAGNLVNAFTKSTFDVDENRAVKKLLDIPVSQFVRFEADLRNYLKLSKNIKWANRLYLGYGIAYGNSISLPFVKQFSAGGSNDIRAFQARSLGPGSYLAPSQVGGILNEQYGDIKLGISSELRFKIFSLLYGALFADAGNIWLGKEDVRRPGSGFKLNKTLDELAIGIGLGLRVDVSIFVIRLDGAFPIRKPYLPQNNRWVINQIDFNNKNWRKQNLILNIGIGYPF